ncbi:response regulator [Cohnella sp. 56]|uniref:response regulator n=1 Tax=Cohnella sp. 56 TaxID=3113722 RepID=UPI0030EA4635
MSKQPVFRVVVAEDEPMILNNICAKIERVGARFEIVGRAMNGLEAWEMVERLQPDVLFTDIRMPIMDGIEVIRRAAERFPDLQSVVVSGYDDFSYARLAIRYGAKDYLLKPVEAEDMETTLHKLLEGKPAGSSERELLAASLLSGRPAEDCPPLFANRTFWLALVQLGNYAGSSASAELASFYDELWTRGGSAALDAAPWPSGPTRTLVRQPRSSARFVVGMCETHGGTADTGANEAKATDEAGYERWLRALCQSVSPYPVTVVAGTDTVAYRELFERSQQLSLALEREAVPGHAQVLRLAGAGQAHGSGPSPWLETNEQHKIGTIVQSGKKASLRTEILGLIGRWEERRDPQRIVEKRLLQLLQLVHQRTLLLSEDEIGHLELELLDKLYMAPSLTGVAAELYELLESAAFVDDEREHRDTHELADHIAHYLSANFASPVTLSELSDKFSFSPSYVTKVFKQHRGIGPLKYLISLRMEEAKRLIARHPELSFKEIGASVGYEDPNYFSRIFKSTTGTSLSDYSRCPAK